MRFFRMPHLKWKKEQISASATVAAITATAASESIIAPSAAAAKKKDDPQTAVVTIAPSASIAASIAKAATAAEKKDDPQAAVTAPTIVSATHFRFTSLAAPGASPARSGTVYGEPLSPVPPGRKIFLC